MAALDPASTLIYRWVGASDHRLVFKNSTMGGKRRNLVKNTQRHSDKENWLQQGKVRNLSRAYQLLLKCVSKAKNAVCSVDVTSENVLER